MVFDDGVAEEFVALLRAVAVEGFAVRLFVDPFMHGFHHSLREGFSDVADTTANDASGLVWIGFRVGFDASGDFRKEVTCFEFEEIRIDRGHGGRIKRQLGADARPDRVFLWRSREVSLSWLVCGRRTLRDFCQCG